MSILSVQTNLTYLNQVCRGVKNIIPRKVIESRSIASRNLGGVTAKGYTGDSGAKGDTGDSGAKGDTGNAGAKGDTGDSGAKGDTGDSGAKGDTGDAGAKGDSGANGGSSEFVKYDVVKDGTSIVGQSNISFGVLIGSDDMMTIDISSVMINAPLMINSNLNLNNTGTITGIQCGMVTPLEDRITFIYFPKRFETIPVVTVSINYGGCQYISSNAFVVSVDKTHFTYKFGFKDGSHNESSIALSWIAISSI